MTTLHDRVYLIHILQMTEQICIHLDGKGKSAFLENITIQQATLRSLQLMAESAKRLSDEAQKAMSEIAWHQITGFRNVLVHEYLGNLDLEIVWETIVTKVPEFEHSIQKYYEEHYD